MKVSDKYLRDLLREVVSIRAGGKCEFLGCQNTECDPAHRFTKKNLSLRYNADACLFLCANHHTIDLFSAHRSPDEFWKYIIKSGVRSQEWEDKIIKTKNIIITGFENAFRETCKFELLEELGRLAA